MCFVLIMKKLRGDSGKLQKRHVVDFCFVLFLPSVEGGAHSSWRHVRHTQHSQNQWLIDWPSSMHRYTSVSLTPSRQETGLQIGLCDSEGKKIHHWPKKPQIKRWIRRFRKEADVFSQLCFCFSSACFQDAAKRCSSSQKPQR